MCVDLELMEPGEVFMGVFIPYRDRDRDRGRGGYPRKTWWKFWEGKRTRDEFLGNEHERRMTEKECHGWKNQEFHFCGK